MRLELTRVGLLVELANHYTTSGALVGLNGISSNVGYLMPNPVYISIPNIYDL